MTTTTQITEIEPTIGGDYFGDYADDFDIEAINVEFLAEINRVAQERVPSLLVAANGMVFVDVEDADAAREIDWEDLFTYIDVDAIITKYDRTAE